MMIYIIVFLLTCLFCVFVQKCDNPKKKFVFSAFAVLIPSLLAGLRATNIGTDVNIYASRLFDFACNNSFVEFIRYSETELGYSLLVYVVSIFSKSVNVLLFFNAFIIILFFYLFAYNKRDKVSLWLSMLVFLLVIYNSSLNLMRQMISISIITYSLTKIENKKYISTIILFIIALLFHNSCIFALPIYPIFIIFYNQKLSKNTKKTIIIGTFLFLLIFSLGYKHIAYFLANVINILPDKYYNYLTIYSQDFNINFFELLYKLFFGITFVITYLKNKETFSDRIPYFLLFIIDFLIFPVSFSIKNADRLGYYYLYPAILLIVPSIKEFFKMNKYFKNISLIGIVIILFIYWYRIYVVLGFSETYPYYSEILKILNL